MASGINSLILGTYSNLQESNVCELKELCLKNIHGDMPDDFDEKFTDWTQNAVEKTLEYYSQYIIPKYISGFINTQRFQNKNEQCSVYIGIDDFSQITGIPILKGYEPPIERMREIILESLQEDCILNINIIPCETDIEILEDEYETCRKEFERVKKHNENLMTNYVKSKREWLSNMRTYTQKMSNIVNDSILRQDCIRYIRQKCPDTHKIQEFVEILQRDERLDVPRTPEFAAIKENPNELFYWIVRWKDSCLQEILKVRPEQPCFNLVPKNLRNIQKRLTYHRFRWLMNQDNLQYYVIRIDVSDNRRIIPRISSNECFKYWDKSTEKWKARFRITIDKIPQCLTLYELNIVIHKSKVSTLIEKEHWCSIISLLSN
jgi:hypothetical protein